MSNFINGLVDADDSFGSIGDGGDVQPLQNASGDECLHADLSGDRLVTPTRHNLAACTELSRFVSHLCSLHHTDIHCTYMRIDPSHPIDII